VGHFQFLELSSFLTTPSRFFFVGKKRKSIRRIGRPIIITNHVFFAFFSLFTSIGAQFGTIISMPLSGLLADWQLVGGWPSIFYVFGVIGTLWCIAFLIWVYEDPEQHPSIAEDEKKFILSSLWGSAGISVSFFSFFFAM